VDHRVALGTEVQRARVVPEGSEEGAEPAVPVTGVGHEHLVGLGKEDAREATVSEQLLLERLHLAPGG